MSFIPITLSLIIAVTFGYFLMLALLKGTRIMNTLDMHIVFVMIVILAICIIMFVTAWSIIDPVEYREYMGALQRANVESNLNWKAQQILNQEHEVHLQRIKEELRSIKNDI